MTRGQAKPLYLCGRIRVNNDKSQAKLFLRKWNAFRQKLHKFGDEQVFSEELVHDL